MAGVSTPSALFSKCSIGGYALSKADGQVISNDRYRCRSRDCVGMFVDLPFSATIPNCRFGAMRIAYSDSLADGASPYLQFGNNLHLMPLL